MSDGGKLEPQVYNGLLLKEINAIKSCWAFWSLRPKEDSNVLQWNKKNKWTNSVWSYLNISLGIITLIFLCEHWWEYRRENAKAETKIFPSDLNNLPKVLIRTFQMQTCCITKWPSHQKNMFTVNQNRMFHDPATYFYWRDSPANVTIKK